LEGKFAGLEKLVAAGRGHGAASKERTESGMKVEGKVAGEEEKVVEATSAVVESSKLPRETILPRTQLVDLEHPVECYQRVVS